MVVDDNADAAQTLKLLLSAAGHNVEVAYCGTDALALAVIFEPEVCLLDIGLPDFDGNELARRLRQMPEAAGATIVALTGYGRQQDRDAAGSAGFDHYLVKPLDTNLLTEVLTQINVPPKESLSTPKVQGKSSM